MPRFDTLIELVRVLEYDLLLVPRQPVPSVRALVRDHERPDPGHDGDEGERRLFATAH